jgi:hypothetical protein
MKMRVLCVPFILLITLLWAFPTGQALAQDVTIINPDQLAQVALSANYSIYLPFSPWDWRAYPTDWPLWCDSAQLTCLGLLPTSTNVISSADWSNVPLASVILTKDVLSGLTTIRSSDSTDIVATITDTSGCQPYTNSANRWLWISYVQATNNPDWWGLTPGEIPLPVITLQTFLVDSNAYYSVYQSNLEAEAEAAADESSGSFSLGPMSGGGFLAMDDPGGGDPCSITNDAAAFYVTGEASASNRWITTTWQSCTDHVYIVQTEKSLTPTSSWADVAWMFGANLSTSWTDTNAPSFSNRFYRVVRGNPNALNGGIPYGWAVSYGLDPLNPDLATNDVNGNGYTILDDYLMASNPTNPSDPVTVYVDVANTSGTYDGSQANPFQNIQDAIESSVSLSSNLAIRVRPGTNYVTVSNLQYDPSSGNVVSSRPYVFIYAANEDWSLSTDPEKHVIDALGMVNAELGDITGTPAPTIEFNGVARARINGFKIRGGQGIYAGGIYAVSTNNGSIFISNCIIEKNGSGSTEAGGIYIQAATNSMIYNTAVAENLGEIGGIYDINGVQIWNCTIVSNTTLDTTYGAVTGGSGAPNILNSIIWSNGFDSLDLYFANVDYSTFGSNEFVTSGAHNLSVDPILVNMVFGNYRLQTNSPVVGAGESLPIQQSDLYGNPRPLTGRFDIGANEYTDSLGSGMQDDWEIKHGLSLTVNQAALDPDGDGVNNLQEYNQNTDPNNPDTAGDGISDGPTVPTGSGLQPGPSADPTTPDETWNTVFWDYFYQSQFETYINGEAESQWINEPDSRPCAVVVNNFHVGDHVNLQWQYLGGQGFQPFLVFYVPAVTKGVIIPDLDAVPLDQIQVGSSGYAPPNGPWGSTIALTTLTNTAGVCAGGGGYDDETPKLYAYNTPWLSVPQNGSNNVTVTINPTNVFSQIIFNSSISSAATITPAQATGQTQVVQVVSSGVISNVPPDLNVQGYGAQNSYTTTCATVALAILPKATNVTVAIYAVTAQGEPGTAPTNAPSQASLSNYLNQVYGQQVNVYMNVLPLTNVVVNYDLNRNGSLDYTNVGFSAEQSAIISAVFKPNAVNVYYVHALYNPSANPPSEGITYGVYTNKAATYTFIQDAPHSSTVNVTAHEIGHALGLKHPEDYGESPSLTADRLMRSQDVGGSPCRLIEHEWFTVSGLAK